MGFNILSLPRRMLECYLFSFHKGRVKGFPQNFQLSLHVDAHQPDSKTCDSGTLQPPKPMPSFRFLPSHHSTMPSFIDSAPSTFDYRKLKHKSQEVISPRTVSIIQCFSSASLRLKLAPCWAWYEDQSDTLSVLREFRASKCSLVLCGRGNVRGEMIKMWIEVCYKRWWTPTCWDKDLEKGQAGWAEHWEHFEAEKMSRSD